LGVGVIVGWGEGVSARGGDGDAEGIGDASGDAAMWASGKTKFAVGFGLIAKLVRASVGVAKEPKAKLMMKEMINTIAGFLSIRILL
jgi:hypothetical protein